MELVSIVILNYNGAAFLERFLPTVIRYSPGCKIVVADNASTDDSIPLVRKKFPEVQVIPLAQNFGFCGGYNRALAEIDTPYSLLLNSDVEVTEGWVAPLVQLLEDRKDVAAVQPKIRSYHRREFFEYAGAAGGFIDKYGYPFCRGRIFDTIEKDEGQYDEVAEVFWATGACVLVRTRLFLEFGGFDEHFFAHMEEIDLCWRWKNAGFSVLYCPDSVVYHVGGGTLPKDNPRKVYLNFRNSLFVLVKNLPAGQVVQKVFMRLCLDFPAALNFLVRGSFSSFWSVFKAHIRFYLKLNDYLKKRRGTSLDLGKTAGYYGKSILLKFYLFKVRKYTQL